MFWAQPPRDGYKPKTEAFLFSTISPAESSASPALRALAEGASRLKEASTTLEAVYRLSVL